MRGRAREYCITSGSDHKSAVSLAIYCRKVLLISDHTYICMRVLPHGNAVEGYYRRIVPCMEMGPRTSIIQR
jgi:hypothetical protein